MLKNFEKRKKSKIVSTFLHFLFFRIGLIFIVFTLIFNAPLYLELPNYCKIKYVL